MWGVLLCKDRGCVEKNPENDENVAFLSIYSNTAFTETLWYREGYDIEKLCHIYNSGKTKSEETEKLYPVWKRLQ